MTGWPGCSPPPSPAPWLISMCHKAGALQAMTNMAVVSVMSAFMPELSAIKQMTDGKEAFSSPSS